MPAAMFLAIAREDISRLVRLAQTQDFFLWNDLNARLACGKVPEILQILIG
jgi:hypothetical protein